MARKYKSDILRSVHRAASDLAEIGAVDKTTMREFDRVCLTKEPSRMAPKMLGLVKAKGLVTRHDLPLRLALCLKP